MAVTEGRMMEVAAVAPEFDCPLFGTLEHLQLLAGKRLSDAGRQRLEGLEARLRLLATLLDHGKAQAGRARAAIIDVRAVFRNIVAELDAVLDDEAPRPY
jgi:hypothetical protein